MIDRHNAIRIAQAALLLGSILTGLSWFEGAQTERTHELGGENLRVDVRAPVQHPQGPWDRSTVFTEDHAGIPTGVAPIANVTATYATDGLEASDHAWTARLNYQATGDSGREWWSKTTPIALNTSGEKATANLNVSRIVAEARSMEEATRIPTRLTIELEIVHRGTAVVDGDPRETEHVATVGLEPREGFVVVETQTDASTYSAPVEQGLNWVPIALAGTAIVAEVPAFAVRRGRDPWEGNWGVDAVEVDGLEVPKDAPRTDLDTLVATARDRSGRILVDREANLALAPGEPALWARIDEAQDTGTSPAARPPSSGER